MVQAVQVEEGLHAQVQLTCLSRSGSWVPVGASGRHPRAGYFPPAARANSETISSAPGGLERACENHDFNLVLPGPSAGQNGSD